MKVIATATVMFVCVCQVHSDGHPGGLGGECGVHQTGRQLHRGARRIQQQQLRQRRTHSRHRQACRPTNSSVSSIFFKK